eukprot:jgi/Bigna1/142008/aug1.66_g16716
MRSLLLLLLGLVASAPTPTSARAEKPVVIYVPLDERFATRGLWLNLAKIAGSAYEIRTPPPEIISRRKKSANISALHAWVESNSPSASAMVASAEMLLYGGLIASRISNDSESQVTRRLEWLAGLSDKSGMAVYLSTVVMRIPSYNGDFEEPWYWADYGASLYNFSYFTGRYNALHDPADRRAAGQYRAEVPAPVVQQFLWRRSRNHNITRQVLQMQATKNAKFGSSSDPPRPFAAVYITLDDSGQYGLNVEEAGDLQSLAFSKLRLPTSTVKIYPGADEVGSALLARLVVDERAEASKGIPPSVYVLWRLPNSTHLIPNYENQPVNRTVYEQLEACGLQVVKEVDSADVIFAVNNFGEYPQLESSQQVPTSPSDYSDIIAEIHAASSQVIAFADVRYSNGGDLSFVQWMFGQVSRSNASFYPNLLPGAFAYAGWNTDGNTLGTAAANAVLLWAFNGGGAPSKNDVARPSSTLAASKRFTLLRVLEDAEYQSAARNRLVSFVESSGDEITDLAADLGFYERFSFKLLAEKSRYYAPLLKLDAGLTPLAAVYYPWNRTFEIGLTLSAAPESQRPARHARTGNQPGDVEREGGGEDAEGTAKDAFGRMKAAETPPPCDVIVIGGSTAALASALSSADASPDLHTCLVEPTTWPGGQLTASLISAVDFGHQNRNVSRLPDLFVDLLETLGYPSRNPGACWVSTMCYRASDALERWIFPALRKRSANLHVFYETVVSSVETRETSTGASGEPASVLITGVVAVTRTPRDRRAAEALDFSAQVSDWYDHADSEAFTKTVRRLARQAAGTPPSSSTSPPPVVIDASEFGDGLVLSGASFVQGNELDEGGLQTDDTCGQAFAFPCYLNDHAGPSLRAPPDLEKRGRHPSAPSLSAQNFSLGNFSYSQVWSYRRVAPHTSLMAWGGRNGDGNDFPYGYLFLDTAATLAQKGGGGGWRGGLNVSNAAAAERQSLDFAEWYSEQHPKGTKLPAVATGGDASGTARGLSKMPYVRDTRRSVGLAGFRLTSAHMANATRFPDRVGLGDYLFFDEHGMQGCRPMEWAGDLRPYYLPLRALTNRDVSNLLVAGKTMAQTNAANAGTRLHPVEWASGTAAGIMAALMLRGGELLSAADVVESCLGDDLCPLQKEIQKVAPIDW